MTSTIPKNDLRLLKQLAAVTFKDKESFQWLHKAHPLLNGETPLEAAKTSQGARHVQDILHAIKYGGVL